MQLLVNNSQLNNLYKIKHILKKYEDTKKDTNIKNKHNRRSNYERF